MLQQGSGSRRRIKKLFPPAHARCRAGARRPAPAKHKRQAVLEMSQTFVSHHRLRIAQAFWEVGFGKHGWPLLL